MGQLDERPHADISRQAWILGAAGDAAALARCGFWAKPGRPLGGDEVTKVLRRRSGVDQRVAEKKRFFAGFSSAPA
jgi:hypothetical protein